MLTLPSSANSTTTLSLPPATLAVTTSDAVSTRATTAALPAPLSDQQVGDNAHGNTTIPPSVAAEEVATTVSTTAFTASGLASNINSSGPSSSFLAQFFAQSTDEDSTEDFAATAGFAPTPQDNTFVGYGYIKYKPSYAGVPAQRSPLPSPVFPAASHASAASQVTPAQAEIPPAAPATTQTVNANDTSATDIQQPVSEPVNATVTFAPPANQNSALLATADTAPFSPPAPAASPVFTTSASTAYSQTQSRNQSNLSFAEPQIVVAG